jgi:hypothetical protein
MALTDFAIRNAKPSSKPQKLSDGAGLCLLVTPAVAQMLGVTVAQIVRGL